MKKSDFQDNADKKDKTEKSGSTTAAVSAFPPQMQARLRGPAPPAPKGFASYVPVATSIRLLPTVVSSDPKAGSRFLHEGEKGEE